MLTFNSKDRVKETYNHLTELIYIFVDFSEKCKGQNPENVTFYTVVWLPFFVVDPANNFERELSGSMLTAVLKWRTVKYLYFQLSEKQMTKSENIDLILHVIKPF